VYAWTAIEGMLGDLFTAYLDGKPHTGGKRRKRLESSDMTAWHKAEILSLADGLPFDLYGTIARCRKARNTWLHDQGPVSERIAHEAIGAAEELFELAEGVRLRSES
jgi:hypothetical protein